MTSGVEVIIDVSILTEIPSVGVNRFLADEFFVVTDSTLLLFRKVFCCIH